MPDNFFFPETINRKKQVKNDEDKLAENTPSLFCKPRRYVPGFKLSKSEISLYVLTFLYGVVYASKSFKVTNI